MSGPERFAGGEAARPSERGRCPRQEQRPAGSCTAPAPAEPARPPSAARRCLPSIPPVYSILSRPVPPKASRPAPRRCGRRRATHQTSTGGGGAAEETRVAGSAETPRFIPLEGQRRAGPRRAGAATFSLFGRSRGPERPRSHEWSRASPGAARPPGPCKAGAGQRGPGRRMAK